MREVRMRILSALDFNELEIEDEIGEFEVVKENENSVIIESEFGVEYKVTVSKMNGSINIEEVM